jgi:hypothetical protein
MATMMALSTNSITAIETVSAARATRTALLKVRPPAITGRTVKA